jgi:hypothetical protein
MKQSFKRTLQCSHLFQLWTNLPQTQQPFEDPKKDMLVVSMGPAEAT